MKYIRALLLVTHSKQTEKCELTISIDIQKYKFQALFVAARDDRLVNTSFVELLY